MKLRQIAAVAALAAALAGCFTSDRPLISDAESATPFKKITFTYTLPGFWEKEVTMTATLEGKSHYVTKREDMAGDDTAMSMRFLLVGTDLYLAEWTSEDKEGRTERVYGLVKLDRANNAAVGYKVFGGEDDDGPGLRVCMRSMICIDDINAYVALAKRAMATATKPDVVYKLKLE